MPKTRSKAVNCNSHKEECEDFLIFDRILKKVEENFIVQIYDHFKDEGYRLLNSVQNSMTDKLQLHESE